MKITAIKKYSAGRNEEKVTTHKRVSYMDTDAESHETQTAETRNHATMDDIVVL